VPSEVVWPSISIPAGIAAAATASATASSTATATPTADAAPAAAQAAPATIIGTFTGPSVFVNYGNVQVKITVVNGRITDAVAVKAPSG
jgi:uncharacterized protein with FMN-binding domain